MSEKFGVSWKEIRTALVRSLQTKTSQDVIQAIVEDFYDELVEMRKKSGKPYKAIK